MKKKMLTTNMIASEDLQLCKVKLNIKDVNVIHFILK